LNNLRRIISNLDDTVYSRLEYSLVQNKAENFLCLLRLYRASECTDEEILDKLRITQNSLYVLKSRLNDRIQEHLGGNLHENREELHRQLVAIPALVNGIGRELACMRLKKTEADLLKFDMHLELMTVYSALKKIHSHDDKYYHYSTQYNKHAALHLSLEKSEDILSKFNRVLAQYMFSRSELQAESLLFMQKEIGNHLQLNPSRQTRLIRNIILIQLSVFGIPGYREELPSEDLLTDCFQIINELPVTSPHKEWDNSVNYLAFEFYFRSGQNAKAGIYFSKTEPIIEILLLSNYVCLVSEYLVSRIRFLQSRNEAYKLKEKTHVILHDERDFHATVMLRIHEAMHQYYNDSFSEAAVHLNQALALGSFRDYSHKALDLKLAMIFCLIRSGQAELAESFARSIERKLNADSTYPNVKELMRIFGPAIKNDRTKADDTADNYVLFEARNTGSSEVIPYLLYELKLKYS
jgi:hypothetical protein